MANVNAPSGFTPVRHANGGIVRNSRYEIASGLASNIYRGSAVIPVNTTKRINVAAAGNRVAGVFHGVSYVLPNGDTQFRPYWATGTTLLTGTVAEATVFDDPDILFAGQVSASAGLVATDVGNFADIVVGTGSAVTGNSGDMIDQTTFGTTDGQLRVEELYRIEGNAYGQYAKALFRWNEHQLASPATTNALTAI